MTLDLTPDERDSGHPEVARRIAASEIAISARVASGRSKRAGECQLTRLRRRFLAARQEN
jgi:hypothetical protein